MMRQRQLHKAEKAAEQAVAGAEQAKAEEDVAEEAMGGHCPGTINLRFAKWDSKFRWNSGLTAHNRQNHTGHFQCNQCNYQDEEKLTNHMAHAIAAAGTTATVENYANKIAEEATEKCLTRLATTVTSVNTAMHRKRG
jgi:hypothetical protein